MVKTFTTGDRVRVSDSRRKTSDGPEYAESRAFYGPAGYYPEFGVVVELWVSDGYPGALVRFENPIDHQTHEANIPFDDLEEA